MAFPLLPLHFGAGAKGNSCDSPCSHPFLPLNSQRALGPLQCGSSAGFEPSRSASPLSLWSRVLPKVPPRGDPGLSEGTAVPPLCPLEDLYVGLGLDFHLRISLENLCAFLRCRSLEQNEAVFFFLFYCISWVEKFMSSIRVDSGKAGLGSVTIAPLQLFSYCLYECFGTKEWKDGESFYFYFCTAEWSSKLEP